VSDPYIVLAVFGVIAVIFCLGAFAITLIVPPRNPGLEKERSYECGIVGEGDPWGRSKIQFYMYALIFLVFDVELLFLFPWAVVFREAGLLGLVEMLLFLGLLVLGWIYAVKFRALRWE